MLPFVLPEGYSGSEKCSACAQCAMEAAGGARCSHGAGMAKKSDGTHVVLIMEKCACVAHCVVHANCGEQFARSMSNVDAGRAVGRVVPRMCQSRRCAAGGVGAHAICRGWFFQVSQHMTQLRRRTCRANEPRKERGAPCQQLLAPGVKKLDLECAAALPPPIRPRSTHI